MPTRWRGSPSPPRCVADLYGLEILANDIQAGENRTRFAVISRYQQQAAGRLARSRHSLRADEDHHLLGSSQRPGSLYRCLGCFADRDVNLSRLESRPRDLRHWDYVFTADLDSEPDNSDCAAALVRS